MSRFGYADYFSSNRSAQECLQAARDCFLSIGCQPATGQSEMEIAGKMGRGWAVRLIGGVIAPATWFPVRLSVAVRETSERREITVRADENFGFGSLMGIEDKTRTRCDELGKQIGDLIKARLA